MEDPDISVDEDELKRQIVCEIRKEREIEKMFEKGIEEMNPEIAGEIIKIQENQRNLIETRRNKIFEEEKDFTWLLQEKLKKINSVEETVPVEDPPIEDFELIEGDKEVSFEGFPSNLTEEHNGEDSVDLSQTEEFYEREDDLNEFESVQENEEDDDFVTVNSEDVQQNVFKEEEDNKSVHTVYSVAPSGAGSIANRSRMIDKDRRLESVPSNLQIYIFDKE